MEKYNKFLRNITELIEKGLFTSRDLKKEVENALKFKVEILANKLRLVSREEFEVQKKITEKLQKDLIKLKLKKKKKIEKLQRNLAKLKVQKTKKKPIKAKKS